MVAALRVEALTKRFGAFKALDQMSFVLEQGEIHALCGENGAGKSTLIRCLSGLWPHSSYDGQIWVADQIAHFSGIKDAEKAGIAVIYQELALVPDMTVAENLFLGAEPTRWGLVQWDPIYQQASLLFRELGIELDPTQKIGELGIGQRQLVEIAKALMKKSRILLLDEPTAALTETEVETLLRILGQLKAHGVSCLYISHKLDEVLSIADRMTVIRDGCTIATLTAENASKAELIRLMVGREIDQLFPKRKSQVGGCVLQVQELTVTHPQTHEPVIKDLSFEVKAGEVLGVGGLMGAGRTELALHLFAGWGNRTHGALVFCGKSWPETDPHRSIHAGMMYVTEDRKGQGLVLDQGIGFNISLAALDQVGWFLDVDQEQTINSNFFAQLQIKAPHLETPVQALSGGNQQKVVLAKALATHPNLVILDEPTRGIDVGAKLEVYALINAMTDAGKAVILISSELPELMGISDRILVLSRGRKGGEFSASEADQEQLLEAAMCHA